MRNKGLAVFVAMLILIIIVIGASVSTYNGLISSSEKVRQSRHNIDVQLQRRNELIPNLVATVKGYAAHEESIFTAVADARSKLANPGAMTTEELAQADSELSSALSRLLVVIENYPELKANQNFIGLQDQLESTENRIAVARLDYNEDVRKYNSSIRRFPGSIFANIAGLQAESYFESSADANNPPVVDFS